MLQNTAMLAQSNVAQGVSGDGRRGISEVDGEDSEELAKWKR
jgi:hypothetical protein